MTVSAEARAIQATVAAALRDLALDVERSRNLGVGVPNDELGWWAELVEREIGESTATVLNAVRKLKRIVDR